MDAAGARPGPANENDFLSFRSRASGTHGSLNRTLRAGEPQSQSFGHHRSRKQLTQEVLAELQNQKQSSKKHVKVSAGIEIGVFVVVVKEVADCCLHFWPVWVVQPGRARVWFLA